MKLLRTIAGTCCILLLLQLLLESCREKKPASSTGKARRVPETLEVLAALPETAPFPADNPYTLEKAELGRLLFYDPVLSGNKDVSCASCHHPEFGFSDAQEISIGVNGSGTGPSRRFRTPNTIPFVKRNAQTVLNTAFNGFTRHAAADPSAAPMFWDIRVNSLEKQALEPIKALEEMRGDRIPAAAILDLVIKRLNTIPEYRKRFAQAFPETDPVNTTNLAKALATYERTLINPDTRFDRYMRGDKSALSSFEIDGLNAFLRSGCAQCHNGPMFSDYQFHVLSVPDNPKRNSIDSGKDNRFAFRTASLRNLAYTYPYMHSGKFESLQQVLEFYEDLGNRKAANPLVSIEQTDTLLRNLSVNFKEIKLIEAFLGSLSSKKTDSIPKRVPSGLPPLGY